MAGKIWLAGCVKFNLKNNIVYDFAGVHYFQGAFAIGLDVWDDDSGNILIGRADDLADHIEYDVANVPAQKDLQSAVAKSVTVRIKG